jgi:hypothetical protein
MSAITCPTCKNQIFDVKVTCHYCNTTFSPDAAKPQP